MPPKRKYVFTAAEVNSGSYVKFTEADYSSIEMIVKEVVSSASIPFVFPNQRWHNTN
jgi:predicted acylesterase/phospholipase RssA